MFGLGNFSTAVASNLSNILREMDGLPAKGLEYQMIETRILSYISREYIIMCQKTGQY